MHTSLCDRVDWVGFVDWNIRDFHSYDTERGATYNAYLIRDEKTALIDTVKGPYVSELLGNIAELCDPNSVDYVICNHAEPDHSGALPELLRKLPRLEVVCNKKCAAALGQHYDTRDWKFRIVATGDTLSLGGRTLTFLDTPMVHWPESMATYLVENKILFSMDAFGQHYASTQRFDDEVSLDVILEHAKTYYANIVMPFGKPVTAALDTASKLDIAMIATSHGVIWRKHIGAILKAYRDWCVCRPRSKVVILFDSMWESTERMAEAIYDGATQAAADVHFAHIRRSNLTRIATEVIDAAVVAFGSATLNRDMMPSVAGVLCYLQGLRPTGKLGMAFGSYGWGCGASESIQKWLETNKWEIAHDLIRCQYRPTPEVLDKCRAAGHLLSEKAIERAAKFAG